MLKTAELPRLTGFLRAFSNVSAPWAKNLDYDPDDIVLKKIEIQERQAKLHNLDSVKEFLVKNSSFSEDVLKMMFKELINAAKEIIGAESTMQAIEGAVVYIMDVLRNSKTIGPKEKKKLESMFGSYPASAALRALDIIMKITESLSNEVLQEYMESGFPKKDEGLLDEEFGSKIKFMDPEPLDKSFYAFPFHIDNKNSFDKLTFRFENKPEKCDVPKTVSEKKVPLQQFNKEWLQRSLENSLGSDASSVSGELLDTIMQMLQSNHKSEELQNELFELLGFDRIDLIQKILENRHSLIYTRVHQPVEINIQQRPTEIRPAYMCQVTVQSETEKLLSKQIRKDEKRIHKGAGNIPVDNSGMDPRFLKQMREAQLTSAKNAPLFSHPNRHLPNKYIYPNVYDSYLESAMSAASISGRKLNLPANCHRMNTEKFEEINIPPTQRVPSSFLKELVPISGLDEIGQKAFEGMKSLNLIQSMVFNVAYNTNENMLVCAPTGAGKTNVAMLTILHEIRNNMESNNIASIKKDKFKIVYVAPMKALASEMVRNFGKRLAPLNIQVKELTGDMQLTKTEIMQTQMLVTTPEKWDVVTRKSTGDVALTQLVRLLILDEVHLLDGDRGPVLEALVARTLRQVESSQSMIRILGLSATLPNYVDVATFLRVNPMVGLFFFDDRFRPVPLSPTFIGVKALSPVAQNRDMDEICYDKVLSLVRQKHQVMVFVHARNATVKTAITLKEIAESKGQLSIFTEDFDKAKFITAQKQMLKSRHKQLRDLFEFGFSVHHAGMLRSDRNYVERYFSEGLVKVLVCTSTLAWGVNLPARAVIIKGTQMYNSKHGSFVDIGVLDVMQIFGRAGRPQFDTQGEGIIITTHDKLQHYLSLLTRQHQIESNFFHNLCDNLNAEVSLGTVTNIDEGVEWLSYTYFFIRMKSNPLAYGLKPHMYENDCQLLEYRKKLIIDAAKKLHASRLVRFIENTGYLHCIDLGRTASHYYISTETVDRFNKHLSIEYMTEKDILYLISMSNEFDQLKVRDDELTELDNLLAKCFLPIKGGCENTEGKVNILLQNYLMRQQINPQCFSLISDQGYIIQNATRIVRFLFEVSLRKGWAMRTASFLRACKMFERQQWYFETPLRQFPDIARDALDRIDKHQLDIDRMKELSVDELGLSIRCQKEKGLVYKCLRQLPYLTIETSVQPITDKILRLTLYVTADFQWNTRVHGSGPEAFWIWVEDPDTDMIYHFEYFLLLKKQVEKAEVQNLVFTISLDHEIRPSQYLLHAVSDRWLGCEQTFAVDFQNLILPHHHQPQTELLNLHPLPVTALNDDNFQSLYNFEYFNPIQTQIFFALYHTDHNVLLGAPTGSGKTIAAEIAMFRVFKQYPGRKVVYIAPLKALVRERIIDWNKRMVEQLGKKVVELTGDVTPDAKAIAEADIIVTTPEKWDGISRSWQTRSYVQSATLMVIDEIHLLGEDRGPVLEVIVSRMNFISNHTERKTRIIGLSTALANANDLANWLGIKQIGLYNFKPSVRPVPLEVHVSGHHGKHYCPRMAVMNKPTYQAIRTHSPDKPTLVFVSSRRQTRLTALDMIAFLAAEDNPRQWVHMPDDIVDEVVGTVRDQNLKLTLAFGIGLHHAGLHERDRKLVEELFLNQKIQVLIATSTLAWGVNLPAHLVVVKGTEYFDGKVQRYVDFPITDVLQMIGRAGRPQFDSQGVAVVLVQDIKKGFYKRFLYDPFPVESSLIKVLPDHLNAEIVAGTIGTKQQCLEYLTWTYFFRRLMKNPGYYGLESTDNHSVNSYLSGLVNQCLNILQSSACITIDEDERQISPTTLGQISSYYYLNYATVQMFTENLTKDASVEKLLHILCESKEYGELPVRHNEDSLNADLAKDCRYEVNPYTFDSPHTKANLLFQAHFGRVQLPCSDYYTDLKSVLDQAIRVIQALIDVSSDKGWLTTNLSAIILLQMVLQARWHDDNTILSLPHMEERHLYFLKFPIALDVGNRYTAKRSIDFLPELINFTNKRPDLLETVLMEHFEGSKVGDIFQTLRHLPIVEVTCNICGYWEGWKAEQKKPVKFQPPGKGVVPASNYIKLHADQAYVLNVNLHRHGRYRHDGKAMAPKFPKQKAEGWFLVLGNIDTQEVIAMKRIPRVSERATHQVLFYTPENEGRVIYTLFLMSDCYLGLDQQFDIYLDIIDSMLDAKTDNDTSSGSGSEGAIYHSDTEDESSSDENEYVQAAES